MKPWLAQRWMDRGDAPAIQFRDISLTYRQLATKVQRRAIPLKNKGVKRGSTIGILTAPNAQNSLDFVLWAHAVFWLGATLVPLHSKASAAELDAQLAKISLDLLLIDAPDRLSELSQSSANTLRFDTPIAAPDQECAPADIEGDDIMTVLFTSGTSGHSKAVPLSVQNHLASASASAMRLGLCEDDHWLCCLPLCHVGGLAIVLRSAIYGTSFELMQAFSPPQTLELLAEERITLASFVPTMLYRLLDETESDIRSRLRAVLIGGGPIDADLLRRAHRRHLPALPTYGMTEMGSQIATLSPHKTSRATCANKTIQPDEDRLDTAGTALDGVEIRIESESGEPCPAGTVGQIQVRGPMQSPGYLSTGADAPEQQLRFRDGWFQTGDMGRVDAHGYLYIEHRISELIVSGGENVDPTEVARVLRGDNGVKEVAVVGVDDPEWGQIVAAAIVRTDPSAQPDILRQQLLDLCAAELASFKIPRKWRFIDAIPRTATSKTHRHQIRALFAPGDDAI